MASDESIAEAEKSLDVLPKYRLRIENQVGTLQHKFCEVQVANCPDPIRIGLIAEEGDQALPTELENLIFWAIIDPNLPWHRARRDADERGIVDWRRLAKGQAIIAEPVGLNLGSHGRQMVSALFGLSHPDMPVANTPPPLVSIATQVKVDSNMGDYSLIQTRLLFEASSFQHPKWRFLSLYRILENAYLSNIRSALLADFEQDASKAVESAKVKLSNETNQLVALAEQADLITEFVAFNAAVDAQIAAGNNYIIKLDRSAATETLYKAPELFKKGVQRFYKMRCSIAHAGTSSVIYEQFSDANLATLALLPFVETIALKSLRITA